MSNKKDWRAELEQVAAHLRDPFRMRLAVAGVTVLVMFFAISEPLHGRIKRSKRDLTQLENTVQTAEEVLLLRSHLEKVDPRLVPKGGSDMITAYLIEIARSESVDLMRIDTQSPTRLGPLESVRVSMDAIGPIESLHKFLHALESGQYLTRVETIAISPPERDRKTPTMQMSVRLLRDK